MLPSYRNGLVIWTAQEIQVREQFRDRLALLVQEILTETNPAWKTTQIEAPLLTPRDLLNTNYTTDDIFITENDSELALRPETTPGSYEYAKYLLKHHTKTYPPFVVWQAGKSFRNEQDLVTKNMRLKEFYQQEFQCFYSIDTMNDYMQAVLPSLADGVKRIVGLPTRIVSSDRLPSYSEVTMDIEVYNGDKWMEVCSVSRRTDFPGTFKNKKLLVLEIAFGLDRLVYNHFKNHEI